MDKLVLRPAGGWTIMPGCLLLPPLVVSYSGDRGRGGKAELSSGMYEYIESIRQYSNF